MCGSASTAWRGVGSRDGSMSNRWADLGRVSGASGEAADRVVVVPPVPWHVPAEGAERPLDGGAFGLGGRGAPRRVRVRAGGYEPSVSRPPGWRWRQIQKTAQERIAQPASTR
ncbi:hypothetical protein GCM10010405_49250 [Streptomyces macrosporus]|uniref:Uncharacterized protein n=1 Tax=Streptomyces macrosporus TaxID=44032 RepID=A0ABP5XL24_9ACTN